MAKQKTKEHARPKPWVPPGHFHSPIPDIEELRGRREELFEAFPLSFEGIDTNDEQQLELVHEFRAFYGEEGLSDEAVPGKRYFARNDYFGYSDAFFLYCIVRRFEPRRVVEIGSGFSSAAMLDIDNALFGGTIDFRFVEPNPKRLLGLLTDEDLARVTVDTRPVQKVETSVFKELGPRDVLFVDLSHVSKTGSDLNDILFRVLPVLAKGVLIHFHDIPYPFEYPEEWVLEGRAWNEVYVLRAFLQYNCAFRVVLHPSYVVALNKDLAHEWLPRCVDPVVSSSLWLQRVAGE